MNRRNFLNALFGVALAPIARRLPSISFFPAPGPNSRHGDISPRTAVFATREMLKAVAPCLFFEKFGQTKPLPEASGKRITFRRYTPL